jgi:phenylpropionate dioxygenase-like ring-hydroxylating dioxygenase large terminal subunit
MSFLYNAWYVAGWTNEVGRSLLSRRILGLGIVFYRTESGAPAAILDRCPHRSAPLHRGMLIGDTVQCGYHGLRFAANGQCVHNPFSHKPLAAARIRSFPVVEKDSMVWIWMGDPQKADPSTIIDCSYINDRVRYRTIKGRTHVAANYLLLIDNLMDLSHSKYLHASSFGTDALTNANYEVKVKGQTVHSNRWYLEGPSLPLLEKFLPTHGKPVEHWVNMRWDAAANLVLDLGMTLTGQPRNSGWTARSPNILTPETDRTTHYFYAYSRTMHLDSAEVDDTLESALGQAFSSEDAPMVEAIQAQFDRDPSLADSSVLLPADAGSARVRKILDKLIAENTAAA